MYIYNGLFFIKLFELVPNGKIVFFPSGKILKNVHEVWKNLNLKFKEKLFIENSEASLEDRYKLIKDYKKEAKKKDGAILLAVCRG